MVSGPPRSGPKPFRSVLNQPKELLHLCQVFEQVRVVLVAFKIISSDQIFNPLLDCFNIRLHDAEMKPGDYSFLKR